MTLVAIMPTDLGLMSLFATLTIKMDPAMMMVMMMMMMTTDLKLAVAAPLTKIISRRGAKSSS